MEQTTKGTVTSYFKLTYLYMMIGVLVTGVSGVVFSWLFSDVYANIATNNFKVYAIGFVVLQLGLTFLAVRLASAKNKAVALSGYLIFTAFEGFVLSPLLILCSLQSITCAFVSAMGLFGAMAVIGYTTKVDVSRWYGVLLGATIAIFIAGLINILLGSSMLSLVMSIITIIVFSGWTIYDNQKLRISFETADEESKHSIAVLGAFELYLDFLNLALSLLRLMSNK